MSIHGLLIFSLVGLVAGPMRLAADEPASPSPVAEEAASSMERDGQDGLLDDFGSWRTQLNNDGWQPFASWTGELWDNTGGGIRTGVTDDMLFTGGTEADLEKLLDWQGGTFRMSFNWVQSTFPNHDTGAFNNPSGIDAADQIRLYNLYLRQKLFNDQLTLKVGQIGMDDDFAQCAAAALFLNGGFTTLPIIYGQTLANADPSISQYPLDAPGLFARVDPKGCPVYVQAGLYLSDAGADASNNHGFGWHPTHGLVAAVETGWNYQWAQKPGTLAAGAYYNDGRFTNWDTGTIEHGIGGFYGLLNQTLCQTLGSAGGDPQPVLTGFLLGGVAGPNALAGPNCNFACGLNWNGPLPFRPKDVAGIAVLYTGFSPAYTRSALNLNGPGVTTAAETDMEFTYQINVTPWMAVQPDFQLVFNPANGGTRATALVVGLHASVTF
jgi:porin